MTDDIPEPAPEPEVDYTTLSGAAFQLAVGADPDRWTDAFVQATALPGLGGISLDRRTYLRSWFRDAMDAARAEATRVVRRAPDAGMTNIDPVDYTTLSVANFRREVGTDPAKWARAFAQIYLYASMTRFTDEDLARWFRDAMEAAREEGRHMERKITGQFW